MCCKSNQWKLSAQIKGKYGVGMRKKGKGLSMDEHSPRTEAFES